MSWSRVAGLVCLQVLVCVSARGVPVTLRVVDQNGVDIPKSRIAVVGGPTVSTGATVEIAVGQRSFTVMPGRVGISGNYSYLAREETVEIDASTESVTFEWITRELGVDVVDQSGTSIPASRASVYAGPNNVPTPFTAAFPITDESVYPTMYGSFTAGFPFTVMPGRVGISGNYAYLARKETVEIDASTQSLTFEWMTRELAVDVVDQAGASIPLSKVGVYAGPSNVPTPFAAAFPITDESVYPTMYGLFKTGFPFTVMPARAGKSGNYSFLARTKTVEIDASTQSLTFAWITQDVSVDVVDQAGVPLALSRVSIIGGPSYTTTPYTVRLPITDEGVYPTMYGRSLDGYGFGIEPPDAEGRGDERQLRRSETVEVDASTTALSFEWITQDVTIDVVDQTGASLPFSRVSISGGPYYTPTPYVARLPITDESVYPTMSGYGVIGGFRFGIEPPDGEDWGDERKLKRTETVEVGTTTNSIDFEWAMRDVTVDVVDQSGASIPQSRILVTGHWTWRPTPCDMRLPITDEAVYPTMTGSNVAGFGFSIEPPDGEDWGDERKLKRTETVEVGTTTNSIDFEWAMRDVTVDVVDQSGASIPRSQILVTGHWNWRPTPCVLRLPVTDEAIYPTMVGSNVAGFEFSIEPADAEGLGDYRRLRRIERVEISSTSAAIDFEWIMVEVTVDVVDESGASIPDSQVSIDGGPYYTNTPYTVRLPITDEAVYPTLIGSGVNGFGFGVAPARASRAADYRQLSRTETIEIDASTSSLAFEWITLNGPVYVVNSEEEDVVGSTFVVEGTQYSSGDVLMLPITDEATYPTTYGSALNGYSIRLDPADTTGIGTFRFHVLPDNVFDPLFVPIDGGQYGLRCVPNQPPVAEAGDDQTLGQVGTDETVQATLDGAESSDPDGDPIAEYTWTGSFPEGGGTVHGINPTVSVPVGVTTTITLVVDDGKVDSDPDTVEITVIRHIFYVDDDAANDPGKNDNTVSDPDEDGSPQHPFDKIQEAMDAAADGDTAMVLAGTYPERLTWTDKSLQLLGAGAADTIVDAGGLGRCLYIKNVPNTARLEGFTFTGGSAYSGGGLYLMGSWLTVAGNAITANSATGHYSYGGGLYLYQSSPTLTDNTITGNSATGEAGRGGGVGMNSSSGTLTGNIITNNTVAGTWPGGGGVYLYRSSPALTGNTVSGNQATRSHGGGLSLNNSSPTLTGNTIGGAEEGDGNVAASTGGGLFVGYGSTLTLKDNTITRNSGTYGGGLRVYQSSGTLTGNTIAGNTAAIYGGGLHLDYSSSPTLTGNTIAANSAAVHGGGLSLNSSSPTLADNTIGGAEEGDGNTAGNSGGGLFISYGSSPTLTDNTITGNSGKYGGGLRVYQSSGTLTGNTIAGNTAAIYGGALHLDYNSSPTLAGNTITANSAGVHGGGLSLNNSSPALTGNTIGGAEEGDGNTAGNSGGGLFISYGSSPTLTDNTITGNSGKYGGGVRIYSSSGTLTDNTISGNTASSYGGGLYVDGDSSPTLTGNTVGGTEDGEGNTAANGGGFYINHSSAALTGNTVSGNTATSNGGGLYVSNSSMTLENNDIVQNKSTGGHGGGLNVTGGNSILVATRNTFAGNSAKYGGGGLVTWTLSSATVRSNTFTGNAAHFGGGVYFAYSEATLDANVITGNSGGATSGGVLFYDSSGAITNNTIDGNTRDGILCMGSSPVVSGNTVSDNTTYGIRLIVIYGSGGDPSQAHLDLVSQPTITGNTVEGNGSWGIRSEDTAATNAGTLGADNTLGTNGGGQVDQWWYGLVNVVHSDGSPAAGASVTLYNNDGNTTPDYGSPFTTDADGYAPDYDDPTNSRTWPRITEFTVGNDGVRATMTPQTVYAEIGDAYREVTHSWNGRYQIVEVRLNTPPVANAGEDQTVEQTSPAGADVTLDAFGSYDPDGMSVPLTYTWTENGEEIATGVSVTVTLSFGQHTIPLTVTDALGYTGTDTVIITVDDTIPPVLTVPADVIAEQTSPDGAQVDIGDATATDACDLDVTITHDAPETFPPGDTVVTWTAVDDSGNASTGAQLVTVVDTTPPQVDALVASPDTLWPPNHKMVSVTLFARLTDACDPAPTYRIVDVTCNQPVNGPGDGNTDPDWDITGDHTVELRAERAGGGGGDRVYAVVIEAVDESGNSVSGGCVVIVPHDQGGVGKPKKK